MEELNTVIKNLTTTRVPKEFLGTTHSLKKFTHNTLTIFVERGLVEFYYDRANDETLANKFDIESHVPKECLSEKFQTECVSMLSALFTNKHAVDKFKEIIKKNRDIKKTIDTLYKITYSRVTCVEFVANLSIYGQELVNELEFEYIIGNEEFSCLDLLEYKNYEADQERVEKLLSKRLNGACNQYNVCTSKDQILKLMSIIEKKKETNKYSFNTLKYVRELLYSFYLTLNINDKIMKKRINDILICDKSI